MTDKEETPSLPPGRLTPHQDVTTRSVPIPIGEMVERETIVLGEDTVDSLEDDVRIIDISDLESSDEFSVRIVDPPEPPPPSVRNLNFRITIPGTPQMGEPPETWLHHNPYPDQPAYWTQNEAFVARLKEVEKSWADHDIDWQVGTEIECRLDDPLDERIYTRAQRALTADCTTIEKTSKRDAARPEITKSRQELRARMERFYTEMANVADQSGEITAFRWFTERAEEVQHMSIRELAVLELQELRIGMQHFERAGISRLASEANSDVSADTTQDPVTHFHHDVRRTMKAFAGATGKETHEGPKTSPPHHDHFYDVAALGLMELRFKKAPPMLAIANHNQAVALMRDQCQRYGLTFSMRPNMQFHVSAHRPDSVYPITMIAPENGMVEAEFDDNCQAYRGMIDGVVKSLHDGFMLHDHGIAEQRPRLCATTSKTAAINLLHNRFEVRCGDQMPPQPAKQLLLVLGGALHGYNDIVNLEETKTQTRSRPFIEGSPVERKTFSLSHLFQEYSIGHENGNWYLESPLGGQVVPYDWGYLQRLRGALNDRNCLLPLPYIPFADAKAHAGIVKRFHRIPLKTIDNHSAEIDFDKFHINDLPQAVQDELRMMGPIKAVDTLFHPAVAYPNGTIEAHKCFSESKVMEAVLGQELRAKCTQAHEDHIRDDVSRSAPDIGITPY